MLSFLFHLSIFLFDIFIKTFVLGTVVYFYGESFIEFMKSVLDPNNAPLATEKSTNKNKRQTDNYHPQALKGNNRNNSIPATQTSLHCRHRRSRTQSFIRNTSRIPSRSYSTSTTLSNRYKQHYPIPSSSTSSPQQQQNGRNSSRVGQLVQRFEIGRRSEIGTNHYHQTDIMDSGMDSKINDSTTSSSPDVPKHINTLLPSHKSSSSSPIFCLSPGKLTTSTSTRAIDYRSIGFRPAFTSWERRTTEGNQILVSSPSLTAPVWSTHCHRQSHPST